MESSEIVAATEGHLKTQQSYGENEPFSSLLFDRKEIFIILTETACRLQRCKKHQKAQVSETITLTNIPYNNINNMS